MVITVHVLCFAHSYFPTHKTLLSFKLRLFALKSSRKLIRFKHPQHMLSSDSLVNVFFHVGDILNFVIISLIRKLGYLIKRH